MDAALLVGIVDDDPSVRIALAALIQSLGYRQQSFASAETFLQALDEQPMACVITDLQMPGLDGIALKGILDAQGSELPVIMITARDDEDLRARANASGARALLQKPFRARELEQALRDALGDRHG